MKHAEGPLHWTLHFAYCLGTEFAVQSASFAGEHEDVMTSGVVVGTRCKRAEILLPGVTSAWLRRSSE